MDPAFLPCGTPGLLLRRPDVLPRATARHSRGTAVTPRRTAPSMIQSPDQDGPPDLAAYFDQKARKVGREGAPISVGTGRAMLSAHGGNSAETARAALARAAESIADDGAVQLCHCTVSLDVDASAVAGVLAEGVGPDVLIVGRSVNKKESAGTVEVLMLRSDEGSGIAYATVEETASDVDGLFDAAKSAAQKAASEAVAGLDSPGMCTFLVYAHTPCAGSRAVRDGIDAALPAVVAYGGPAVGEEETGAGWSLISKGGDVRESSSGSILTQEVHVAAVPGSINFLISSVVKNWAQPVFSEPLSYMTPTYIDDPSIDLLTAIRYDDWDKFIWCLEDQGVDVNVTWPEKQNQSPLLAACARCRTRMIEYMIAKGADVEHRNAGNFTAAMYTRKLTEYDPGVVLSQLKMLQDAGLNVVLSEDDEQAVRSSGDGRIFIDNP